MQDRPGVTLEEQAFGRVLEHHSPYTPENTVRVQRNVGIRG